MSRVLKLALAGNLIVLALLAFIYPHLMVAPGKLIPGHQKLEADCFACHAPFKAAASERCASCHKADQIGVLTTAGRPLGERLSLAPFHQELISRDCVACHSDHAGVKRLRQQGRFDHALLKDDSRGRCQGCHKPPADSLHRQITDSCAQCHSAEKWLPATFDHGKHFVLDRDHNARCVTCHARNDYSRYTCYGCHEHTPAGIRREHIEEGIARFDNCVECHRSANKHVINGRSEGGGRRGGKDHDD